MGRECDVVVMGLGPGGEAVAGSLAEAGLDVIGIEASLVGGECPYWACVPSKMMVRAADLLAEARRIPGTAGTATVDPDWGPVAARIRSEATDGWDDSVAAERFADQGGTLVRGRGRLVDRDTVEVDGIRHRGRRGVVIATGSSASIPPVDGLADTPFWTNHEAIATTELPASSIVLGGGAVGTELGQVFARFGVEVTLVERADRLLPAEEPRAGELLAEVLRREGVEVITGVAAASVAHDDAFAVTLGDGRDLRAQRLLVATGRRVDLDAIGAEAIGIDPDDHRTLPVDGHQRVTEGVWAVGDVTGRGAFTHVATYQARIAVADILGEPHAPAEYDAVPRVTFTDPEVASVGMSTSEARDAGLDVAVGRVDVADTARGWLHGDGNEGFVHLVADRRRGVLVGATSMGPHGGEVLGMLTLAVHARTPIEELRTMVYAYPTFHRGVEDALADLS